MNPNRPELAVVCAKAARGVRPAPNNPVAIVANPPIKKPRREARAIVMSYIVGLAEVFDGTSSPCS